MKRRIYTGREKKEITKKIIFFIAVIIIIFAAVAVLSKVAEQRRGPSSDTEEASEVVEIHGIKCTPKTGIRTWLFIGADKKGSAEEVEGEENPGQSDVLELVVLDKTAGTYTRLSINRDTMTEVRSLEPDGTDLGTAKIQIALAHASGDGLEMSCENTVEAVSGLLYGQKIDGYVSLGMDGIPILNHLAGGVTVTIEDDFSKEDLSLKQGETITLSDEQAMHFVRGRMGVGDGTNENRMKRQRQYLEAIKPLLMEKCRQDNEYPLTMYDELADYMVTDMSRNDFIKVAASLLDARETEPAQIEGTSAIGDWGFNEFTPDEDSLAETVVDLFYDRVEK